MEGFFRLVVRDLPAVIMVAVTTALLTLGMFFVSDAFLGREEASQRTLTLCLNQEIYSSLSAISEEAGLSHDFRVIDLTDVDCDAVFENGYE